MVSVVIAAHNEASVIGAAVRALLDAADDLDIVVVCNGCSDDTAAVARSLGHGVRVIELDVADKTRALNVGDEYAVGFPRFYVDADVQPSSTLIDDLSRALVDEGLLAAAPALDLDTTASSWPVRAYLAVWQQLPQVRDGLSGRGVYALSAAGHARLGRFPSVINDDGYVSALFADGTGRVVRTTSSRVRAPDTLSQLARRRARVVRGNEELRRLGIQPRGGGLRAAVRTVVAEPRLLGALAVFLPVSLYVRALAWSQRRRGSESWGTDASARARARGTD